VSDSRPERELDGLFSHPPIQHAQRVDVPRHSAPYENLFREPQRAERSR
jgi:hypothetical protein